MSKQLSIYKCELCGNVVEVFHAAAGDLTCCGETMEECQAQYVDPATNKHVPIVEKVDGGYKITVGSTPHPMTAEHCIEWIELLADDNACRCHFQPGDVAEVIFNVQASKVKARSYCNLHGLWQSEE